jgi:hypothetical protein
MCLWKKLCGHLVKETLTKYVHLVSFTCFPITCTFKSWMSKGAHYVVVVIVNFPLMLLKAKNVIIGLFETLTPIV